MWAQTRVTHRVLRLAGEITRKIILMSTGPRSRRRTSPGTPRWRWIVTITTAAGEGATEADLEGGSRIGTPEATWGETVEDGIRTMEAATWTVGEVALYSPSLVGEAEEDRLVTTSSWAPMAACPTWPTPAQRSSGRRSSRPWSGWGRKARGAAPWTRHSSEI